VLKRFETFDKGEAPMATATRTATDPNSEDLSTGITDFSQLMTRIKALESEYGLKNQIGVDIRRTQKSAGDPTLTWNVVVYQIHGGVQFANDTGNDVETIMNRVWRQTAKSLRQNQAALEKSA
jgi:hypothetical protein